MDENLAYLRFENLNSNNLNNDEINKLYRGCWEFSKDNLIICNIESETIQIMGNMAKVLNSEKRDSVKFTLEEFSNIIYDDMNGDEIFNIWNKIIQRNKDVRLEFKLKDINNRTICVNVKLRAFYDEMGYVQFYFGLIHDVTRERRAEEELKNIVDFDVVTNLPSSTYTKRTIDNYLKISQKENESCALVLVNIDNFKYINDTYGHDDGDRILKKVAIRLSKIIEAGDLICRYSG